LALLIRRLPQTRIALLRNDGLVFGFRRLK
jgi:hypothetical protein